MLKPHGYAQITDPGVTPMLQERDVFSCCHCSKKVHVKPLTDPAAWPNGRCLNCEDGHGRGLICDKPECHERCSPFFKRLEQEEALAYKRQVLRGLAL